jgi:hypothetical protein
VVVIDKVADTDKLGEIVLDPVSEDEDALVPDTDPDSDRLFVIDADTDFEKVTEAETDFDSLTDADTLLESVGSNDAVADTLRLTLDVCVSLGSVDADAVVDGVKLGETGDAVTDGVMDGVGKNTL